MSKNKHVSSSTNGNAKSVNGTAFAHRRAKAEKKVRSATELEVFRVQHSHNEISGLIAVHDAKLLRTKDWQQAFWIVNDEKEVHKALAVLGRRKSDEQWEVLKVKAKRSRRSFDGETDDSEAMARAGSYVYIFGSQFGSKEGPLDPERNFVARYNESRVRIKEDRVKLKIKVARRAFRLHRIINDAFDIFGIRLIERGDDEKKEFIDATRELDKRWRERIKPGDHPINVEGATFGPTGRLLLGLRYPVTVEGHPIIVEVDGIDRLFKKRSRFGDPEVTDVHVVTNLGSAEKPRGIRELDCVGTAVHLISGDLDSSRHRSQILSDHPEGERASNAHHCFDLPPSHLADVEATHIRSFDDDGNVEGLAISLDGRVWYIHDDDDIILQVTKPH